MTAELSTLVTYVTVDATGFKAGMQEVANEARKITPALEDATKHTKGWGSEIATIGHKFTTLGGIMKIGLGVGTAKAIIGEVHHAVLRLGEGFAEASKAGAGFGNSISEAATKMLGLKTVTEELAEAHKKMAEARTQSDKANDKIIAGMGGVEPKFPHLKDSKGYEADLKEMDEARNKALGVVNGLDKQIKEVSERIEKNRNSADPVAISRIGGDRELLARLQNDRATAAMESRVMDERYTRRRQDLVDKDKSVEQSENQMKYLGILGSGASYSGANMLGGAAATANTWLTGIFKSAIATVGKGAAVQTLAEHGMAEDFHRGMAETEQKSIERQSILERYHPGMKFARLREEARESGLYGSDLKRRMREIDSEQRQAEKGSIGFTGLEDFQRQLQGAAGENSIWNRQLQMETEIRDATEKASTNLEQMNKKLKDGSMLVVYT